MAKQNRMRSAAAMVLVAISCACARELPEEDRRILTSTAIAKLSPDDLWKDYQQSPSEANSRYWGRAVEVTGAVTNVLKGRTPPAILFGPAPDGRVRAQLLGDQAAELVETGAGQRIKLKCFCAGLDGAVVVLKSCVKG
jgi:hypothetical protein